MKSIDFVLPLKTWLIPPAALILVCSSAVAQTQGLADNSAEEIYMARSVRESRGSPTDFCAPSRTLFDNLLSEELFTFRSIVAEQFTGRVVDASTNTVGRARTCFGPTRDATIINFYAEITLAGINFAGRGECRVKQDHPNAGLAAYRCFLELSDLPSNYIGGLLTTNTIGSRNTLGERSDPPGYTQGSIATVRLWKRRR